MISSIKNRGRDYKINVPDEVEFYCVEPRAENVDRILLFLRRKGESLEDVLTRARTKHANVEILRPYIGDRDETQPNFGIDSSHSGELFFDVHWESNKKSTILDSKKYYALVNFKLLPEDRDRILLEESGEPSVAAAPSGGRAEVVGSVRVAQAGPAAGPTSQPAGTTFLSADIGRLAAMWHELPTGVRAAIITMAEASRGHGREEK